MNKPSDTAPGSVFCRFCHWLYSVSSKQVLAALMITYLIFAIAMVIAISRGIGAQIVPLDLRFWYQPEVLYATFDALGAAGRHRYLVGALTLDVFYPLIYSSMFAVWLTLLLPRETRATCALRLLPFAILAVDLLENSLIAILLAAYPEPMDFLAWSAAICTATKWSIATVVVTSTLALTLRAGWRALRVWINSH